MIIGISGKKQAGKDTVGKIVQYFTEDKDMADVIDINSWLSNYKSREASNSLPNFTWQIKWFAEPLKDIVCILLGCTRQQLEDNEFKEKELGEEWWKIFF